jgi:hypothetical protein
VRWSADKRYCHTQNSPERCVLNKGNARGPAHLAEPPRPYDLTLEAVWETQGESWWTKLFWKTMDFRQKKAARKAARVSSTEDLHRQNLGMGSAEPSSTTSDSQRINATERIEGTGYEPSKFTSDCPDHRGFIRNRYFSRMVESDSRSLFAVDGAEDSDSGSGCSSLRSDDSCTVPYRPPFPLQPQPHGPFQDPGSTH